MRLVIPFLLLSAGLVLGQAFSLRDPVFAANVAYSSSVIMPGSTLTNGLVAYYSFESMLVDSTGHGNTLTDHNSVTHDASGKIGFCSTYTSASSQYLSIVDNAYFQMGTNSFFLGAWVKYTSTANQRPVAYGRYGFTGYWLNISTAIYGWMEDSGNAYFTGGFANHNDGAWHYAVMVVNRNTQTEKVYVDNNLEGTADITLATSTLNNSSGFQLGSHNAEVYFDGSLDEVGLWGRLPTPTELYNLFNGTNGSGSGTTYPFNGFPAPTNRFVLAAGDSIMAGYTNWTTAQDAGGPSGLRAGDVTYMLATNSGSKYVGTNYGANGNTVSGIKGKINAGFVNNPDLVLMEGGINDLAASSTFSQQLTNYDSVLATCKLYGIHLFVENVWPSTLASWVAISNYNASLSTWVSTNTGVSLVLMHDLMADATGTNLQSAYTFDGIHPTLAGVDQHSKIVRTNLANYYGQ